MRHPVCVLLLSIGHTDSDSYVLTALLGSGIQDNYVEKEQCHHLPDRIVPPLAPAHVTRVSQSDT